MGKVDVMRVRTSSKKTEAVEETTMQEAASQARADARASVAPEAEEDCFTVLLSDDLAVRLRDDMNWTLERARVVKNGKHAGATRWEVLGYYGASIIPALRRAFNVELSKLGSTKLVGIDETMKMFVDLIDPVRTKVFEAELEGARHAARSAAREATIRECAAVVKGPEKAIILAMLDR